MSFNIVTFALKHLTPDVVAKIAHALGMDKTLAQKAIIAMAPAILSGIASRAAQPSGGRQLAEVLAKQDPGFLGKLGGVLDGPQKQAVIDNGSSLLGSLLGGPVVQSIAGAVAKQSGIGAAQATGLLGLMGPIVIGSLAEHQRASGLDEGGLSQLLAHQKSHIDQALKASFGDAPIMPDLGSDHRATSSHAPEATRPIATASVGQAEAAPVKRRGFWSRQPSGRQEGVARPVTASITDGGSHAPPPAAATSHPGETAGRAHGRPNADGKADRPVAATRHKSHQHRRFGAWGWTVPLAMLLLGGVWWWQEAAEQKLQTANAEKARIEAGALAAAETARVTALKAKADADDLAAKVAAEAKLKAEAETARLAAAAQANAAAAAEAEAARAAAVAKAKADTEAAEAETARQMKAKAEADAEAARVAAAALANAAAGAEAEAARLAAVAKSKADAEAAEAETARITKAKAEADAEAARVEAAAKATAAAAAEAESARAAAVAKAKADADAEAARVAAAAKAKADADAAEAARVAAVAKADEDARILAARQACQVSVSSAAASGQIEFAKSSATLAASSHETLNRLAAAMKSCPSAKFRVEGHTDSDGDPDLNKTLSENRAKSVTAFLVSAGIEADRLNAMGLGQTKPIAPNDTAANKRKNRRIEFIVEQF